LIANDMAYVVDEPSMPIPFAGHALNRDSADRTPSRSVDDDGSRECNDSMRVIALPVLSR